MLKRILTALILIPIFIYLTLRLSPQSFCILTGILVLWSAFEWTAFMGIKKLPYRFIYPVILIFIMLAGMLVRIPYVIYVTAIWWVLASVLIFSYPKCSEIWGKSALLRGIMGIFVLVPCWLAINFIRNADSGGAYTLLFLFVLIWSADSGAYFAGKLCGKNKMAPLVSPGKSWQGLAGGLLASFIVTVAALLWVGLDYDQWPRIIFVEMVTVLFSVIGDLFESMMKRQVGLKDSGHLLPGHGGILDRIDSLTAAAPIFVLGALLLERFAQ